jgi:protein-L-isoaspartate(D-aspartate) O-methyltransferase
MDPEERNGKIQAFFRKLDRSAFIDNENKAYAKIDEPLSIGFGQTISQPTLVEYMTELLEPEPDSTVLEIGTGSGYQTAFLAEFAGTVHTVEIIPELAEAAKRHLESLGYRNIRFHIGNGTLGWPESAPYDRIIVTAAPATVPPALVDQLKPGGRMVIPVGQGYLQDLLVIKKDADGKIATAVIEKVRFVQLVDPKIIQE